MRAIFDAIWDRLAKGVWGTLLACALVGSTIGLWAMIRETTQHNKPMQPAFIWGCAAGGLFAGLLLTVRQALTERINRAKTDGRSGRGYRVLLVLVYLLALALLLVGLAYFA